MSDETNFESPEESGNLTGDNESLDRGAPAGSDSTAHAASIPDSPGQQQDDDEFEIIFYATIDGAPDEQKTTTNGPKEAWPQDDIKILLPAWSETTVSSRTAAAPPPLHSSTKRKRSPWRGCMLGIVAAVIVFSLLGSSLFSVFWFWNLRSERMAEVAAMLDAHSGQQPDGSREQNPLAFDEEGVNNQPLAPVLAATPGEPVNRIVFINDNRQIETISPDGADQRQLTADAKSYLFPAWSQDGRSIAAIGTTISGAGIYIMPDETPSTEIEEVYFSTSESPFYLYWSPDGQQITFLANDRADGLSLNVTDLVGNSPSRSVAAGSPLYWNWTADSRQMLVHSGSGASDAELVMIDDFGRQQAPRIPTPGPFQAPGISPSGRYWAYSQFQAGGTSWLVIDDRLSGAENSKRHAGSVAFSWSPTADEVAFISGDAQNAFSSWGPLQLIDAQTGVVRLLTTDTVLAFFWSPDGRKIAAVSVPEQGIFGEQFEVRNDKGRRLARNVSGSALLPAAQAAPHDFSISVIDVESGEGLQLLETGLSPIFLTQFLPYFDQYAFSHQIWSPDSNTLVLPLAEERQSRITLVDTRNGRTTPLAEGSIGFWSRQ